MSITKYIFECLVDCDPEHTMGHDVIIHANPRSEKAFARCKDCEAFTEVSKQQIRNVDQEIVLSERLVTELNNIVEAK